MVLRVQEAADQPIVTFSFGPTLDPESIRDANVQAQQLLERLGRYYAVIDVRDTEITFGEAAALLNNPDTPAVVENPRITVVFVGTPVPGEQPQRFHAPIFHTLEEAYDYIRQQIAYQG